MPISDQALESAVIARARLGALLAFVTNGALVGSLLPRYPEIADALDLTTKRLGFVVVAFAVGAAAAGHVPERPLRRYGTTAVTTAGTWAMAVALVAAAAVVQIGPAAVWVFAFCLGLAGYVDAIVDVAQNAEGLRVQQTIGRSILTTMHAGWSAGAAVAGLIGATAGSLGVPLPLHLAVTGVASSVLVTAAAKQFLPPSQLPSPEPRPSSSDDTSPVTRSGSRVLVAAMLVALSGLSVEVVGNDWSAWFVREIHTVGTGRAGYAVAAVLGAQFVGRALGDRVIDRLGETVVLQASLTLILTGLLVASWSTTIPMSFAGFAIAGLGSAPTVPLAFAAADRLPGLPPGRGIAVVAFAMRTATLAITPVIGVVGDAAGLRIALTVIALLALAALLIHRRASR